jgi:uncharacterized membrane protein YphA (DoxX/SURF4 family)/thiol-disulfide isomerase/thioredoxin
MEPGANVELALLIGRLLLAAVFLLAGVAKYADPKGTSKAFTEFGLPRALAAFVAMVLPFVEAGVAIALVPVASAWYGACGALALLGIFIVGIVFVMVRGRKPDCRCFGQLHSAPVGATTLIRNGILGALAGWLVWMGPARVGPSVWRHVRAAGENEQRLVAVAAFIFCFLIWRALRQRGAGEEDKAVLGGSLFDWGDDEESTEEVSPADASSADTMPSAPAPKPQPRPRAPAPQPRPRDPVLQKIIEAGTGWPVGTLAPAFRLPDLTGEQHSLHSLLEPGKVNFLVFSSPHCESCRALWPYLGRWSREYGQALNLILISRGSETEKLAQQNGIEMSRVLLQQEFEISDVYGVTSTPAAVLVGADGRIQSPLAVGREEIQKLMGRAQPASSSWYADTSKEKHA